MKKKASKLRKRAGELKKIERKYGTLVKLLSAKRRAGRDVFIQEMKLEMLSDDITLAKLYEDEKLIERIIKNIERINKELNASDYLIYEQTAIRKQKKIPAKGFKLGRNEGINEDRKLNPAGLAIVLSIMLAVGLFSFKDIIFGFNQPITGLAVEERIELYTEAINLSAGDLEYNWTLGKEGKLKSFKLTGIAIGNGSFKVYLRSSSSRYLVADNSALEEKGISKITGLAIGDAEIPAPDKENNETGENNGEETNSLNATNETAQNETLNATTDSTEKTINLRLEYKPGSIYDADNDGVESIESAIDYTVENTEFSWDVNKTNLCTRWLVYNIENGISATLCYGSAKCCNFVDLASSSESWNDVFYAYYGKYGAGLRNNVSAQVLYVDYGLEPENIYSEIYFSNWSSLKAEFAEKELVRKFFSEICVETCDLSLEDKSYILEIEAENVTLVIDSISYSVIAKEENITKNETNATEEVLQQKAEINKPVKWIKKLHLKNETEIPEKAANLAVRKITEAGKEDITKTKAKTKPKARFEDLERNISLAIEDAPGEYEIEYETEAPRAVEEEKDKFNKKITISSNFHYENISAYTSITEAPKEAVRLYWYDADGNKVDVTNNALFAVSFSDLNGNSLVDRIDWNIPSLSNQTFEVSIIILNPYTFVRDYENWTVAFDTTGTADLVINSTNANWQEILTDNPDTFDEMRLLSIKCGENDLSSSLQIIDENGNYYNYSQLTLQDSVKPKKLFIPNYNCISTGYIKNYMLKAGYAVLMFSFGSQFAFAYDANIGINFSTPSDINNGSFNTRNWTFINVSVIEPNPSDTAIVNWNGTNITIWDKNLVALYHLDNETIDYSGNGHNLSIPTGGNVTCGSPFSGIAGSSTLGIFGSGCYFNQSNNANAYAAYLTTNDSHDLDGMAELTVCAWFNSSGAANYDPIVTKRHSAAPWEAYSLYVNGFTAPPYRLVWAVKNFSADADGSAIPSLVNQTALTVMGAIPQNQWVFACGMFNGTNVSVWLNATKVAEGRLQGKVADSNAGLFIGSDAAGKSGTSFFNGTIDEVWIYNRSLTQNEIRGLWNMSLNYYKRGKYFINITNQSEGTYDYYAWINDTASNSNSTETRTITFTSYTTTPAIAFRSPTDANNSVVGRNWTFINVTVNESNPDTFIINWNGTNVTIDDNRLFLLMHFNNNSAVGENNSLAVDESRYGHKGALVNFNLTSISGPGVAGKFGKGIAFDGVNDYVNIPSIANITSAFTISAWIKPERFGGGSYGRIVDKAQGTTTGYMFYLNNFSGQGNSSIRLWVNNAFASANNNTINLGVWQHVAVSYNTTNANFYINGVLSGRPAFSTNPTSNTANLTIGWGYNAMGSRAFNGTIDEVRIYNRSLSSAEISASYKSEFGKYFTNQSYYMNQTDQPDGTYTYYAWINYTATNSKATETRTITFNTTADTTAPVINWVNGTGYPSNITNTTLITFYVNATDASPDTCMIYTNATGGWTKNVSVSYASDVMATFATQSFSNGSYKWSVWCNDTAGNLVQHIRNYTLTVSVNIPAPPNATNRTGYPSNAVDGNDATPWLTGGSTGSWLYVDLGATYDIDTAKLIWLWDDDFGLSATSKIQISIDAATWNDTANSTRIKDVSNNAQKETLTFNPVNARYVRFYAEQWNGGWGEMDTLEIYPSLCKDVQLLVSKKLIISGIINKTVMFGPYEAGVRVWQG